MIRIICEEALDAGGEVDRGMTAHRTFDVECPALEAYLNAPGTVRVVAGAHLVDPPPAPKLRAA